MTALWVNLHLGFVIGLLLCVGYVVVEATEFFFAERRALAVERLKRAWPWLVGTAAATLINPWGARIFVALIRQQEAMQTHSLWIREWVGLRISWTMLQGAFSWRQPSSALWWLLIAALVAFIAAVFLRQLGAAILLLGSALLCIQHIRFEAFLASIVVVVGGCLISDSFAGLSQFARWGRQSLAIVSILLAIVVVGFAGLAVVRVCDLVSNRLYLSTSSENLFGTGLSWWFPERALAFVEREHLPGNVFNDYNVGGYLTWRLPQYPDYIDGRAIPFGAEQFKRAVYELPQQAPDSLAWQEEAQARGINTIVVSIANGVETFPNFRAFCQSDAWRPVYLDEVSAVFLRRTSETQSLIERLQIDCSTLTFSPPLSSTPPTARARADLFNFWLNSSLVLSNLDRGAEALQALNRAQAIFPDNNNVHFMRAVALIDANNLKDAEIELRRAIDVQADESTWFTLAQLLVEERRYIEAAEAGRKAADLSSHPQEIYLWLGRLYLDRRQPKQAVEAFDNASRFDIFAADSGELDAEFKAQVAEGGALSWWALGDKPRAIRMQEQAAAYTPQNVERWKQLAAMYQGAGRFADAQRALARADER